MEETTAIPGMGSASTALARVKGALRSALAAI
jgi:hypothetical protein